MKLYERLLQEVYASFVIEINDNFKDLFTNIASKKLLLNQTQNKLSLNCIRLVSPKTFEMFLSMPARWIVLSDRPRENAEQTGASSSENRVLNRDQQG